MGIEELFTQATLTSRWKKLSIEAVAGEKGATKKARLESWRIHPGFISSPISPAPDEAIEGIKVFNRRHASKRGDLASEARVSKTAVLLMSQKLSSRLAIELDFREELP
jgi:hypothetical protein